MIPGNRKSDFGTRSLTSIYYIRREKYFNLELFHEEKNANWLFVSQGNNWTYVFYTDVIEKPRDLARDFSTMYRKKVSI